MDNNLTVAEQIDCVIPKLSSKRNAPLWPPDMFAVCASILHASGAYCVASCNWPPRSNWVSEVSKIGEEWRRTFKTKVPKRVQKLWTQILLGKANLLLSLPENRQLCIAIIELLSIADEACRGVGVPFNPAEGDPFDSEAEYVLINSNWSGAATLCVDAKDSTVRVLPKMHVPTSGFTIRSFSHYLAFIPNSEIKPYWHSIGTAPIDDDTLDILILPWPKLVERSQFKRVKAGSATMKNLPPSFGFFEFEQQNSDALVAAVIDTVQKVSASMGQRDIDAVIMPELSLSESEYSNLSSMLLRMGVFLIAGVGGERRADNTKENTVRFNIPLGSGGVDGAVVPAIQSKHHRWKIEEQQIRRYGLSLPKTKSFWEHIPIGDRKLSFLCLREWLAMCLLVCEDLARPDPVGDVIRAVGPNLVIALLLDGPQLDNRWSARYATALADDPGSSVLTLTSLGMTNLGKAKSSDIGKIALWKDVRGITYEIDVKSGDSALLHIEVENRMGWTIDGRNDGKSSGYPLLKSFQVFKSGKPIGGTYYV